MSMRMTTISRYYLSYLIAFNLVQLFFFLLSFQVGAKCRVELQTENDRQMYTCHIQKIGTDKSFCVVFVENFGKEYLVGSLSVMFHIMVISLRLSTQTGTL